MKKMNANQNYNVFNLGSGDGHSVLEVLTTFERLLGYRLNYEIGARRPGDLERLVTASKKAELLLGWKTKKTLSEMCESCISFTKKLIVEPQRL